MWVFCVHILSVPCVHVLDLLILPEQSGGGGGGGGSILESLVISLLTGCVQTLSYELVNLL